MEKLRSQDGLPVQVPPSVQALLAGGTLDDQRLEEAWRMWQDARAESERGAGFAAEETLYALSLVLPGALLRLDQHLEARALLEASRDLCQDARHREAIASTLARSAACQRDVESAARWIALIEPYSDDLHIDSAYRLAGALIATARGEWDEVVALLGPEIDQVPIVESMDQLAAVLRANAHERRGDVDRARDQLLRRALSAEHLSVLKQIIAVYSALDLCPASMAAAEERAAAVAGGEVMKTSTSFSIGHMFGPGLYLSILLSLLVPLIFFTGIVEGSAIFEFMSALGGLDVVIPVLTISILVGAIAFAGKPSAKLKTAREELARLKSEGLAGHATVLSIQQTGTRVNKEPVLRFVLQIDAPGHGVYLASHDEIISTLMISRITPGQRFAARVDRDDPAKVLVEWSG